MFWQASGTGCCSGAERSVDATWRRIGTIIPAFSNIECANYFASSGYASD
jgi:hypothetical protein